MLHVRLLVGRLVGLIGLSVPKKAGKLHIQAPIGELDVLIQTQSLSLCIFEV